MAVTLPGYLLFIRTRMNISTNALPDTEPVIGQTLELSVATVNPGILQASPLLYDQAVYNLAGDYLINYAPDVPGNTYFEETRKAIGIYNFAPGVVTSAGDGGTSGGLLNPDFMKEFTLGNLQNLKTPWGRQYLAIAQSAGPLWGLS